MPERQPRTVRDEIVALINDTVDVLVENQNAITPGERAIAMACIAQALATLRIGDGVPGGEMPGGILTGRLRRLRGHEPP